MLQQRATIQRAEGWATNGPPQLLTELGMSRIGTTSDDSSSSRSISPLQGSPSPFASRELYYPPSFVGDWNVTATLQQKIFPYGPDFVLSRSLVEGSPRNRGEQVGDSTSYVARSPVIADSIQWDSTKDPTRLSFQRESVTADMRPVGPVKAEVYLTARKTEELLATTTNEDDERIFASDERSRTVTLGTGSVTADDCEIITEFRRIDNDTIQAVSRFAVYLTPNPNSMEGVLWQQVNGKAVAFYDYEMLMERKKE
jgi:hypothetical protein